MDRVFEFKNFRLRKAEQRDAEGLVEISSDWDVMEFFGENDGVCKNLEQAKKQIEWFNGLFNENSGRWIIVEKENDRYIGDIGFNGYDEKHRRTEMGYRLKKEFWGQGIISAFIYQLIALGFEEMGYNRIEAMVDERNPGSKKVLTKNGFIYEGTLREYEWEHGGFVNLEMYSVLKHDYEKSKGGKNGED